MSDSYRGIGVDGCPGGWAAVVIEGTKKIGLSGTGCGNGQARAAHSDASECEWAEAETVRVTSAVYPNIASLWSALQPDPAHDLLLIDMPIGLPEGADGLRNSVCDRRCDRDCRKLLPRSRKSSVFPVPARQALRAASPSAANQAVTGRKLSCQSLNLLPKIRELDDFIAARLAGGDPLPLLESHPEVAFLRLNGEQAPLHGKKTAEGLAERLDILEQTGIDRMTLKQLLEHFPRKQAARDDLLDAAALALTAQRIRSGRSPARYVTEGTQRQFDYSGRLEMNIVYI
ncbi:hypothetical protein B9G55_22520 [Saccharibacillus sp. O16]|nr:hypothetical protein B9G55_22520 [Saccharibacillus sp. O16]